jgi:hypothetical protein
MQNINIRVNTYDEFDNKYMNEHLSQGNSQVKNLFNGFSLTTDVYNINSNK